MKMLLEQKIEHLQNDGWTVEIIHNRNVRVSLDGQVNFGNPLRREINPKGGYTAAILERDGVRIVGEAFCSKHDNYSRKIGANIALGRAMKKVQQISAPVSINQLPQYFAGTLQQNWGVAR